MYFLIDKQRNVIFGWSAKCGCSHIKNLFNYLTNISTNIIHHTGSYQSLPFLIQKYTLIIFSRNPFKRLVSGFLDRYKGNGNLRHKWKYNKITFEMFVNELIKNNYNMIERHHFTPQTSEKFNLNKIHSSRLIKFFDIENIDYEFIEKLYNKKITDQVKSFRGDHLRSENIKNKEPINNYVYNLDMEKYINHKVDYKYFYNRELKQKVFYFYKNDFIFFKMFNYNI